MGDGWSLWIPSTEIFVTMLWKIYGEDVQRQCKQYAKIKETFLPAIDDSRLQRKMKRGTKHKTKDQTQLIPKNKN